MSYPRLTLLAALFALALTTISSVHANINCVLPQGGIYNAGDSMPLAWSDDGAKPKVTDTISMKSALYCNAGNKIADIPIAQFVGPSNVTVPFVGNATTAGGTQGPCAGNAFHVEYSGEYMGGFLDLVKTSWGPVRCATVTINPSPNNTLPVTTTNSATPTSATTTTKKTATTSSSSTNTPSETPEKEDSNKGNTTIIIVGIVAGLVLILLFSAFMWHMRRQKIRRMESAIMPWSNQPNNNFSKMSSSMDDGPRSPGKLAAAGAGAVGAAAAANYSNKAQPDLPQQSHGAGGGYYDDDRYGYQQGYNNTLGSNYHHQGGYDGYGDDTYYNPHYATQNNQGYGHGHGQGQGQGQVQGYEMNQFNGSYYSNSNASRTPYQDPYQAQQPVSSTGYFPPPPPVNSGTSSPPPSVPLSTPGLTTVPISSSTTLTASSSPKRGPQTILPEMGRPADEPTSPRS
ncbi:hypothetical protein BGZ74_005819 [Mortierella antarctica]|nr:hypothetical protein BGZ74_005819 [Mortierella antarctica]